MEEKNFICNICNRDINDIIISQININGLWFNTCDNCLELYQNKEYGKLLDKFFSNVVIRKNE